MPQFDIPQSVVNWLSCGERGISSDTIVSSIWGLPASARRGQSHPHDPDDLKRCLKLLAASPETKTRFEQMRTVSPEWSALVTNWGVLETLFLEEAHDIEWSSRKPAKKTYAAMKRCIEREVTP